MPKTRPNQNTSRQASSTTTTTLSLSVLNIVSLLDCHNFLSPHDYSAKTIGLLASVLRHSVGDINFSDLLHEAPENTNDPEAQVAIFVTWLEEARKSLPINDASIEKCLMLNQLITYINKDKKRFTDILAHIRGEMKTKMTDNQTTDTIVYPKDFRQREVDFANRKNAQEVRRLFYFGDKVVKEPPNLIHLQNRITAHFNCLIDDGMKFREHFQETGPQEMINLFRNSFLITNQPHSGVNPVFIYDRKRPGLYEMKGSVIIVSLLHDWMETHPNDFQLYDIEVNLFPSSTYYKLDQPRSIAWHTCHLHACPGVKPQKMKYAKLTSITIQQTCPDDTKVHFAQLLHKLEFKIRFRIKLNDARSSQIYEIPLESLPFAIGAHPNQISQLLTRVILDDIKRFSNPNVYDMKTIKNYIILYFIHRTGVDPNQYTQNFLDKELIKALNERKDFQTLEDIYMDFLVPFVYQIEFMGKHPLLAMLYADRCFIGPCNSADTYENIKNSMNINSNKVALRYNSIKVDYKAIAGKPILGRVIHLKSCAIRLDIYNKLRRTIKFHTLNSYNDISRLARTAYSENNDDIHILSDICGRTDEDIRKSFSELKHYYHDRLDAMPNANQPYQPLTDLRVNIAEKNSETILDMNFNPSTSDAPTTSVNQPDDNQALSQTVLSLTKKDLIQDILSKPELYADLIQQLSRLNLTRTEQSQQSPVIISNQTTSENSAEFCSMDDEINDVSEQHFTQTKNSDSSQSDIDLFELLTRDPMSGTLDLPDLESSFDELLNDIPSSQDNQ